MQQAAPMWQRIVGAIGAAALAVTMLASTAEAAARCRNTGSFERWLDGFKQEAAASGISNAAVAAALGGVTFDPAIGDFEDITCPIPTPTVP